MKRMLVVVCLMMGSCLARADEIDEAGLVYRLEQAEHVANAEWQAQQEALARVEEQRQEILMLHQEIESLKETCKPDKNTLH